MNKIFEMKRTVVIILLALIALVAGYILFTKEKVTFSRETSLYKAVPVSAPLFVEVSSLKAIPEENPVLNELSGFNLIGDMLQKISLSEKAISEIKEIQSSWGKRPFILAYDIVGENSVVPVIISPVKNAEELDGFKRLLGELGGNPNAVISEKKYSGHKIFMLTDAAGKTIYFSAANGLIILSPESIMVEKGLRQLNSENLTDIPNFTKVNKTVTSDSEVAWYINHERFPELLAQYINNKTQTEENEFGQSIRSNLRRKILELKDYASWSEVDLRFKDDLLSLNGITTADDSLNHFITIFDGQSPERCNAGKILPRNTSFYISFTFSDRDLFFQNLVEHFKMANTFYTREEQMKKIERGLGSDSRETLKGILNNEVIAALTDVSENSYENSLFIVNINSKKNSEVQFEDLLKNYAQNKKADIKTLISSVNGRSGESYTIYKFPYPSLPGTWLGETFAFAKANYATFIDNYLVFASSKSVLQEYINDMEQNYSLEKDPAFSNFIRSSENHANISSYANINRLFPLKERLLNAQSAKDAENYSEILRKVNALSWQMVCDKAVYFNSINLGFTQETKSDSRSQWACNIGTELSMKPQLVSDAASPGQKNIIAQDKDDRLHMISADGRLLWTAPVSGPVLSDVFEIDVYRNGKIQYLFNTKEKLYLIDRNGNSVSGFPVVFDSPATNGVNVFDYDNNRKYRYFIAFENRTVKAFDQNGKPVNGWIFGKTGSKVNTPVQHFRVNNKDYIVFKDAGKIYIQDRRGDTRVKVAAQFENSDNPLVLNLNGTPKIVATDKSGTVYYLYFDGKYTKKSSNNFSADHFFTVDDLDGNNVPDFIFIDDDKLLVTDENGKKLFDYEFDNAIVIPPSVYTFSANEKMVGISDSRANELNLFNPKGKQYDGFPLSGNSAFSIGALKKGQLQVLSGSGNGELVCYELK